MLPTPVAAQHIAVNYVGPNKAVFYALCSVQSGITHYNIYEDSVEHGNVLIATYPANGQEHQETRHLEAGVDYTFQMYAVNDAGQEIIQKETDRFTAGVPSGALEGGDTWNAQHINGGTLIIRTGGKLEIGVCEVNNLWLILEGGAELSILSSNFTETKIESGSPPLISNGKAITIRNSQFTGGEFILEWEGTGDNFEASEVTFSGCRLEVVNADQVIVDQSVLNDSESKIQDANRITVTDTHINQSFDATALVSILMQRCENDEGYSPRIDLRTPLGGTVRSTVDIEQCEFHGDGSGLFSWSASNIALENNVSSENIFGFYCGGADTLRFITCEAANNQKAGFHLGFAYEDWYGVHQNCNLVNCNADGNGTAGVVLRPEGDGHVIEGGVYKNSPILIDNQGTDNFGLEHVQLEYAGETGVQVRGEVTSGRMNRCYIIGCPIGTLLDDVQGIEVNRTRFEESGETGLRINKGSDHVIIHSQFDWGDNHGVVEESASNIRYTYSAFLDNLGTGLYRKDASAPGIIENCTFRANFGGGLVCENSDSGTIEKNALLDNGLNGMRLSGCTNMTITQNRIMRNKDAGLQLGSSAGNWIYDNSFRNDTNAIATALNTWNREPPVDGTNIIGGPKIGGNEWSSYIGEQAKTR